MVGSCQLGRHARDRCREVWSQHRRHMLRELQALSLMSGCAAVCRWNGRRSSGKSATGAACARCARPLLQLSFRSTVELTLSRPAAGGVRGEVVGGQQLGGHARDGRGEVRLQH